MSEAGRKKFMSNVIKLGIKPCKINIKLKDSFEEEVQEAAQEKDRLREMLDERYQQGYKTGHEEAVTQLQKEYAAQLMTKYSEAEKILNEINENLSAYDPLFENLVVKLSIAIGEKIVKREVKSSSHINEILMESIRKVLGSNNTIVRLNPEDFQLINNDSQNLFSEHTFSKIKFEPDDRIEEGGCFIESEIGNVDARLSTQINEIKKQFELSLEAN